MVVVLNIFFFQAEDGIRDLVRSRGLGDVYKRQVRSRQLEQRIQDHWRPGHRARRGRLRGFARTESSLSLIHI